MLISLLTAIAILLLSYLFAVGAMQKLANTAYLRQVISDYQILPRTWSPLLARTAPLVELGSGLALLIPASRTTALGAVTLLLGAYSAAIALNIVRGRRDIDCGCAGPGQEQTLSGWLLGRNAVLITLALLAVLGPQQLQLDWSGWSLALMGTALAALLYHVFNQLVANNNLLRRIARHG